MHLGSSVGLAAGEDAAGGAVGMLSPRRDVHELVDHRPGTADRESPRGPYSGGTTLGEAAICAVKPVARCWGCRAVASDNGHAGLHEPDWHGEDGP
jgi:hypothetical protein